MTSPPPPRGRLLAALLLTGIVALWGWTFVIVKDAVAVYGVLPFLSVRFLIGAAALGLAALRRRDALALRRGAAIGLVVGAAFLLQTFGLARSSASSTGLITGLFVVFAPLANRALFGVRLAGPLWAALALALGGLALLTGAGGGRLGGGELMTLGCAALFGLHIALLDRQARGRDPVVLAFAQVAAAALLCTAMAAARGGLGWPPRAAWPALLITGLFASAAAYLVQTWAQQRLTAVQTGLILMAEPLFAVLFGVWLHGDRLTSVQALGALLMVGAMLAAEALARRTAR